MPWPVKMMPSVDSIFQAEQRGECSFGMATVVKIAPESKYEFSDDHNANRPGNEVVWIRLPCHSNPGHPIPSSRYEGQWFVPDHKYPNNQQWTVKGEWPNVTITPSIHCTGSYHGYVRDGVVTDDCDGRKF